MKPVNRCMYCGSPSYGKGCKYAPNGVHFHPNDAKKCSYCGSPNYGKGCKLNPFGEIHLHGVNYNQMFKESIQNILNNSLFLKTLCKDYVEFPCYKLGIIDEQGNKIRTPITEEEKNSYSGYTRTILKIKKYLGSKLDIITSSALLENSNNISVNSKNLKKVLEYEEKFNMLFEEFHKLIDECIEEGFDLEQIETIINK